MIIPRLGIGLVCWFPAMAAILAASHVMLGEDGGTQLSATIGFLSFLGLTGVAGFSPTGRLAFGRCLKAVGIIFAVATAIAMLGHYPEPLGLIDPTRMHDVPILALVIGAAAAVVLFCWGFLLIYDHEPGRPSLLTRAVVPTLARATAGMISDRRLRAHDRIEDGVLDGTGRFDEGLPHLRGFNDYYQQNIRRKLADLEASRSAAIQRRNKRLLVGVPIMLVLSVLAVANIEEDTILQDVVGMILFLGWLATFGYAIGDSRKIKGMAKGVMIESLSAFFQLTYGTRTPSIEMRLFRETGLVPEYDGWVAKEAFSGDRDGVHMVMAEVRLYDHSRKGGRRRRVTKFQGAVLQFGQPKQFLGQTVALARRGLATNIVDQIIRGKPRIRLENQEFEALFDVFADDEVEARYLLTPLFMERMVGLAELVGKGSDLRFAFADNQLLVAVSGWDLFEAAALSHAVSDPVQVQTFINEVGLILDVAETLKLTQKTRI